MSNIIILGQTLYPHKRREEWEAPSYEVAERWADEVNGHGGEAVVETRTNGVHVRWFTVVWVLITAPTPQPA